MKKILYLESVMFDFLFFCLKVIVAVYCHIDIITSVTSSAEFASYIQRSHMLNFQVLFTPAITV